MNGKLYGVDHGYTGAEIIILQTYMKDGENWTKANAQQIADLAQLIPTWADATRKRRASTKAKQEPQAGQKRKAKTPELEQPLRRMLNKLYPQQMRSMPLTAKQWKDITKFDKTKCFGKSVKQAGKALFAASKDFNMVFSPFSCYSMIKIVRTSPKGQKKIANCADDIMLGNRKKSPKYKYKSARPKGRLHKSAPSGGDDVEVEDGGMEAEDVVESATDCSDDEDPDLTEREDEF